MTEDESPYPELIRQLAYSIGVVIGAGALGAAAAYAYFGLWGV